MTYYLCMSFFCCTFAPAKVFADTSSVKSGASLTDVKQEDIIKSVLSALFWLIGIW